MQDIKNKEEVHSTIWLWNNFQTKQIRGLWYCYGTCNGYDYSFMSSCEEYAKILAEAYLRKYGHIN